ncbi:hypothetical protein [Streptomyces sp. NPDC089799]|uniref:hypothetical protein n=1 Tax=Streptomyces sp. NPDC089799 TaxID=3155066 RepID=UPI00342840D6
MLQRHFRYAAARTLLTSFLAPASPGIPADPDARNAALQAPLRVLWDRAERGGLTVYEVAAEVRDIGESLAAGPAGAERLPDDLRELAEKSGPGGEPAVFLDIAERVEDWPIGLTARLPGMVPTAWELSRRFPQLHEMLVVWFGQDGLALEDEDLTDTERIELYVADCHDRISVCPWQLPRIVAECAEALALFTDDDSLRRFFAGELGLGSASQDSWTVWLTLISDTLTDHLRREHGPMPWTGGREEQSAC